jgi:hypothetical protein
MRRTWPKEMASDIPLMKSVDNVNELSMVIVPMVEQVVFVVLHKLWIYLCSGVRRKLLVTM